MHGENRQRRVGVVVFITLIIVAIFIIVGILLWMNCQQWKEGFNKVTGKTKNIDKINNDSRKQLPLIDDTPEVLHSIPLDDDDRTSKRIEEAQVNKEKNVKLAKATVVEQEAIPGGVSSAKLLKKAKPGSGVKPNNVKTDGGITQVQVDSVFDIFTPKEDVMEKFGVTEEQLRQMVKQYREEHKYEVPKAPSTLTFNINTWEEAQERMRKNASHLPQPKRDTELGLIYNLQVDGSDD